MYLFLVNSSTISDVFDAYLGDQANQTFVWKNKPNIPNTSTDTNLISKEIIGGEEKRYVIRPLHLHLGLFAPGHIHKIAAWKPETFSTHGIPGCVYDIWPSKRFYSARKKSQILCYHRVNPDL